jgi:hypothetical protein
MAKPETGVRSASLAALVCHMNAILEVKEVASVVKEGPKVR